MAGHPFLCFVFVLIMLVVSASEDSRDPRVVSDGQDSSEQLEREPLSLKPTVMAVFLARNKAHSLPYFLGYFERLKYPKDRISIWIHTDHNEDETEWLLRQWKDSVESMYQHVDFISSWEVVYTSESVNSWPRDRYDHLLQLRNRGLNAARDREVDYVLYIDMDNILVNPNTLSELIAQAKPIVAPMIEPPPGSLYSNFWCGVDERGFYRRTEEYLPTIYRERTGCFEVAMVHSTYLLDIRVPKFKRFTFVRGSEYRGYVDDMLVFSYQVKKAGMKMFVLNTDVFMKMPLPSHNYSTIEEERQLSEMFFMNELAPGGQVIRSEYLPYARPPVTDFGLDKIYAINLPRQEGRRLRLTAVLRDFGIKAELADAVDGRDLRHDDLKELGIQALDGSTDYLRNGHLTMGDIGRFLSHYKIWADMLSSQFKEILILEDDLQFEADFRRKFAHLLREVREKKLDWDMIYLARKRVENGMEPAVEGTETLVQPLISYWALAYMLSDTGAKKLIQSRPLSKMIAVDEYLSLMFDQHPRDDWKAQFKGRNLRAFSAQPLLIYPTRYNKGPGHMPFRDEL